jgi:hypothetical protein
VQTVAYSASLIGTIRSHLEGLQGYDVMALELIQNADDAGSDGKGNTATEIVFDVTDQGLVVRNDGEFTYCGDLGQRTCPHEIRDGYACDYHRITEVASGGKLSSADNTGRFGIGFVSTYQIADHPQIRSAGIRLTLMPEHGESRVERTRESSGTTFFLPWASDPGSETRRQLGASPFTHEHIEQLVADFRGVLRKALLFLRRIRRAELRRNGRLVLACDLDRDHKDETDLLMSFDNGDVERWLILRADAAVGSSGLMDRFPQLAQLKRKTRVTIGIRLAPDPVPDGAGLLYAYLPTEQPTGLPLHVNADFFPEADRKSLIFSGKQHQQAWNELLIKTAAETLADNLEMLRDKLGSAALWSLLSSALRIKQISTGAHPPVFAAFWDALSAAVERGAAIAETAAGDFERPRDVVLARQPLGDGALAAVQQLGGKVASETLRPHRNTLVQLGSKDLGFKYLADRMHDYFGDLPEEVEPEPADRVEAFYRPLWELADSLLPHATSPKAGESVEKAKGIPFIVDPDRYPTTMREAYRALRPARAADLAKLFPYLWFASDLLAGFPNLHARIDGFDLGRATVELRRRLLDEEQAPEDVVGTDKDRLKRLYELLATLADQGNADTQTYALLRALPIWSTAQGFVSAEEALLPGDFSDPIGQTRLIKQNLLDTRVRQFLRERLGVERQTIEEYVRVVVPRFIGESGPEDHAAYRTLIDTLANHPSILDNEDLRRTLAELPVVPAKDGRWARPGETYFRTEELVSVLGEAEHRWVYVSRAGKSRAVRAFLENLGVRRSPSADHLAERMLELASGGPPTEAVRKASEKAFYEICDLYKASAESHDVRAAISKLSGEHCFPAHGEADDWFWPGDLYAPFRFQAFESQAYVLDFKNTQRLTSDLLGDLGISLEPETELVVNHLLHCVETGEPAHKLVYQILNDRARVDDTEIGRVRNTPCIYLEAISGYVRPNQIYLIPQQLGRYTYNAPAALEEYRALFKSLGVKERPEAADYVDILLDIVGEHFAPQTPLGAADQKIFDTCIAGIAAAWNDGLLSAGDLARLREAPSMLNVRGRLRHPDEVLLRDSEYHRGFFGDDLDDTLCRPADPALGPFLEDLGIRRLSDVATIELDFVDGPENAEDGICRTLRERSEIIARMLYAQPRETRNALHDAIQSLAARSHDTVRIKVTLALDQVRVSAEPKDVKAFYDDCANELILARPVTERSWLPVFGALLHQLMPDEPPSHISHLSLALQPLMVMSLADAELSLADSDIPCLEVETAVDADVTSQDLEGLGAEHADEGDLGADRGGDDEPDEAQAEWAAGSHEDVTSASGAASHGEVTSPGGTDARADQASDTAGGGSAAHHETRQSSSEGASNAAGTDGGKTSPQDDSPPGRSTADTTGSSGSSGSLASTNSAGRKPGRAKSKSLWDRELISYARRRQTEPDPDNEGSGEDAQYKLAIEAAARAIVCDYERERGRYPEEMSQTNPGFDILSRRSASDGIDRYIEIKGTSGEWNKRGVGLSRLQFTNAQDLGDRFWLYVVEFALDEDSARVHAIQNPAFKVDHFMFDGGWRDAAADEMADPTTGFVTGARIDCGLLGAGRIAEVHASAQKPELAVHFDDGRKLRLPLNLKTMSVLPEEDDD